jgi:thymidylate synthase ThyX
LSIQEIERHEQDGNISFLLSTTQPEPTIKESTLMYPEWVLKLLNIFISDVDRPVYSINNLPPEVAAALAARYSRSDKGMIDILASVLQEVYTEDDVECLCDGINALNKLQKSTAINKLHANYTLKGHKSIKKLSNGLIVAIDLCSMLAAEHVLSCRLGLQGMERSTRYQKSFFSDPQFIQNIFDDDGLNLRYEALMRVAFSTGQSVYDETKAYLEKNYPWENSELFVRYGFTKQKWKHWTHNRALDAARYCIPVAASTSLIVSGNAMGFDSIVENLVSCPAPDFKALGGLVRDAAGFSSPLLINDAKSDYHRQRMYSIDDPDFYKIRQPMIDRLSDESKELLGQPKSEIDVCRIALDQRHMNSDDLIRYLTSMIIGRAISLPIDVVYNYICSPEFRNEPPAELVTLSDAKNVPPVSSLDWCLCVLAKYMGMYDDSNQLIKFRIAVLKSFLDRDVKEGEVDVKEVDMLMPLMRLFEMVDLTFDITISFGSWRDMNRHCAVSQWKWPLVPNLGYAVPPEYDAFSEVLKDQYQSLFAMSQKLWEEAKKKHGTFMAQYAALFMWNQRRLFRANIRELDYIMNLRSKWQGHSEYRMLAQLLYKRIYTLWPVVRHFLQVDMNNYVLGPVTEKFFADNKLSTENNNVATS